MDKKQLYARVSSGMAAEMAAMAATFLITRSWGMEEFHALDLLTGWLEREGFQVERGVGGLKTAFRAVWNHGEGGPNIGLLCEYDALEGIGHACAHHLQGPSVLAAAAALKRAEFAENYSVTIYGTPAEESVSGKILMLKNGVSFEELDVALMMHGKRMYQVDVKSLALSRYKVIYHGVSAHAAVKPENGRSALDGLLLAFQGTEFLREHVGGGREDPLYRGELRRVLR